jgi:hypothetical protein
VRPLPRAERGGAISHIADRSNGSRKKVEQSWSRKIATTSKERWSRNDSTNITQKEMFKVLSNYLQEVYG